MKKDDKLKAIAARREGPENRRYGAELDLEMAKAAGDEAAASQAQSRVDGAVAELKALDEAEAKAKK